MLHVVICVGSSCYVRGSDAIAAAFDGLIAEYGLQGKVELSGAFCMERCSMGVSVRVNDRIYRGILPQDARAFFANEVLPYVQPDPGISEGAEA